MRALFTLAIFLGSALLFLVQPMIAKMILPKFGGAPAVWTASLLFFQASLLLGYVYAHAGSKLPPRAQAGLHIVLIAVALLTLPFAIPNGIGAIGSTNPTFAVLQVLAVGVGLPFILVSAGAPMLQRWFSHTNDPQAKDPYFLYAASNAGSMMGLLAYPFFVEPNLTLQAQTRLWTGGYVGLVAVLLVVAVFCSRRMVRADASTGGATGSRHTGLETPQQVLPEPVRLLPDVGTNNPTATSDFALRPWLIIALAAVPASLLTGVTNYITSNVAPIPLLWVAPLALYLLSFILAFRRKGWRSDQIGRWLPIAVTPLALILILESTSPLLPLVLLHLAVFFFAAWMCHRRLAENRPDAKDLTAFYLWISVGGVIGGAFNALLAPVIFKSLAEYPIALVLALLLRPTPNTQHPTPKLDLIYPASIAALTLGLVFLSRSLGYGGTQTGTMIAIGLPVIIAFFAADRPIRFGLAIGAVLLVSNILGTASTGRIAFIDRSFFGVHRVTDDGTSFSLVHGTTRHGRQFKDTKKRDIPLTYYTRSGPIGQIFKYLNDHSPPHDVALVGLGVGTLATYGIPGERMTYYEIDPVVDRIAHDTRFFTYLRDSKAKVNVILGDARLTLAQAPDARYDLIVLDAFSSDAIPVHLLTKEAVAGYLQKLRPGGLLAFHISNHYLDLAPVLANAAQSLGLSAVVDEAETDEDGGEASVWVAMAREPETLLAAPGFTQLRPIPGARVWTDDYSNLLGALKHGE